MNTKSRGKRCQIATKTRTTPLCSIFADLVFSKGEVATGTATTTTYPGSHEVRCQTSVSLKFKSPIRNRESRQSMWDCSRLNDVPGNTVNTTSTMTRTRVSYM